MKEIKYEIIKKIASISKKGDWDLELNYVSWNGRDPKLDLRKWGNDHTKLSKGVTISKDEAISLKEILNQINIDEIFEDKYINNKDENDFESSEIEVLEKYEEE